MWNGMRVRAGDWRGIGVVVIALATGACSRAAVDAPVVLPGPWRDASPVVTDTTVYWLHDAGGALIARATATFVNRTTARVYFGRCMPTDVTPMYWFRRTGADTLKVTEFGSPWACVGGVSPGVVEPGATLSFTLLLYARADYNGQPPPIPAARVGLFRAELPLLRCPSGGTSEAGCTMLAQPERQTNAFEVRF